jgi:hypothetical protein
MASFKFWGYGILAIAALAMVLYVFTNVGGYPDIGGPLLDIAVFIVVAFMVYMFAKLIIGQR